MAKKPFLTKDIKMLIEFSVKNFRSIREKQTFSMVASKRLGTDEQENHIFDAPFAKDISLLKSAVVYGANAAGKSSFISALDFMQKCVMTSNHKQPGDSTQSEPFLFDEHSHSEESEFEVLFVADGIRYQYGFACTKERFTEEWFIAYPKGKPQTWFERWYEPDEKKYGYRFSDLFKGSKKVWENNTSDNTLFFSRAVQLNSQQLQAPFIWFSKTLMVIGHNDQIGPKFTAESCCDAEDKIKMMNFFKKIDLPIADVRIEEKDVNLEELPDFMRQIISDIDDDSEKNSKHRKMKRVHIIHKNKSSDKEFSLPLDRESHGTKKLFSYAAPLIDTLENGKVFVIDELNNSLHPNLVQGLLNMVHSDDTNKNNGQLVFSTHDTSILDLKKFRRDQIWFVEKSNDTEVTELIPLSYYKNIRSNEALAKGYLLGKYGAVPYIEEM